MMTRLEVWEFAISGLELPYIYDRLSKVLAFVGVTLEDDSQCSG